MDELPYMPLPTWFFYVLVISIMFPPDDRWTVMKSRYVVENKHFLGLSLQVVIYYVLVVK